VSKEVGVVEAVDEIVVVVDVCGALDRMDSEIGVDICSFAEARGFLFFKFSHWRSFGIWAEIGNMEEEAT
jgi:hypothetical protein